MSVFNKPKVEVPGFERIKSPLPIEHLDVTKRYDVYCFLPGEERLYEDVKITAIRTLEDITQFIPISELIEIESQDGKRIMIHKFHIHMVCEHGSQPAYKVLRRWDALGDTFNAGATGF